MLFREYIENLIRDVWGDPRAKLKKQAQIEVKDGLLAMHSTLYNTYKSKDESGIKHTRYFPMHLKSLHKNCKYKKSVSGGTGLFLKDSYYYERLSGELTYHYKGTKWFLGYYKTYIDKDNYHLLIRDTLHHGYDRKNIFDDINCLKLVFKSLAQMHCASIVTEARIKQKKCQYNQSDLHDIFGYDLDEMMFYDDESSVVAKFYQVGIDLTCILARQQFEHDPAPLADVLNKTAALSVKSTKHCNVLCHGDLRRENIYFTDYPKFSPCIFMNFYVTRYAPLALDLLQVFYLHTSSGFRKNHFDELLTLYSFMLENTKSNFDVVPRGVKIPTHQENRAAIEDLKLFGPTIALVYSSLSLLDRADIEKFMKDWSLGVDVENDFLTMERIEACERKMWRFRYLRDRFKDLLDETKQFEKYNY